VRAHIQWASAEPVREAGKMAGLPAIPPEVAAKFYVIRAPRVLMPRATNGERLEQIRSELVNSSSLIPKGKPAIPAFRVEIRPNVGPGVYIILWQFPRSPIVAGDGEVEFKSALGEVKFDVTFKLKDMVYRGELAL
jgi:hypothetical protein